LQEVFLVWCLLRKRLKALLHSALSMLEFGNSESYTAVLEQGTTGRTVKG
jgi:hypothetical protein